VPLVTQWIADDEDDEIKGQALEATFPSVLDVPAVLSVLTPPRNPHLIGVYRMFVSGFATALTAPDLPAVLEWAAKLTKDEDKHEDEDKDEDDRLLTRIVDRALVLALDHLSDPVVLDRVAEIVFHRVDVHANLVDGDDELVFREANGRHRLVARIVEQHGAELDRVGVLPFTSPPLVTTDDIPWLLERTRETAGSAQEVAWASLASRVFVPEQGHVTTVLALAEQSNAVRDAFAGWLTPVELDSDIAKRFTARAAKRRAAGPGDREERVGRVDREVVEQLEAFEAGDLDGWWRLNYALAGGRVRDELQADLMALPAWDRAPESVRSRIIAGARVYLEGRDPEPEAWFGTNTMHRPAFAGYRSLRLLAACRPDEFMALSDSTWERWMPIVVQYPRATGIADDSPDDLVVATAASRLAKAMIPWVLRAIDAQNANGDGHLVVLYRLRAAKAPDLLGALAAKIGDAHLTPRARADLVEHLLSSGPPFGIAVAAPYITVEAAAADTATAVTVGSAALAQAPTEAWPLLEPLFTAHPPTGVSIIDNVAHGERTDLGAQLDDDALTRLVAWIFTHIPPEHDPAPTPGAQYMSPRDSSRRLRDRLAQVLAQRGTDVAVTAIGALASRHPVPSLEWRVREAREARLARWTGPEPAHVVQLAQASDARIVLSAEHLQLAVLASLRRIAQHLGTGDPPAARELWEPTDPPRPKSEEALSTWVAAKLDADMRVGGRLVGRELQIRENRTGKGRGESIDIVVATPIGARVAGAPLTSVLIEAKGTWHPQLKTALSDQLANRYLSASTRHGIYLVFWFDRTGWDTSDWRRGKWTKDLAATANLFDTQARDVTSTGNVVVRAFVMDGTADSRAAT
jgi:hypothetical protein